MTQKDIERYPIGTKLVLNGVVLWVLVSYEFGGNYVSVKDHKTGNVVLWLARDFYSTPEGTNGVTLHPPIKEILTEYYELP
jgi:hypothetical protein